MAFSKGGSRGGFSGGSRGGDRGGFSGGRGGDRGGRSGGFGGNRGGGRDQRSFGGKGFEKGPVTLHKVTCDECGNACEVPFKPSSDKPVFCDSCFGGKRENKRGGDRFGDKRSSGPTSSSNDAELKEMRKLLNELNMKLDVILEFFNDEIEEEDALMAAEAEEEMEEVAPKAKKAKAEPKKSSSKKK